MENKNELVPFCFRISFVRLFVGRSCYERSKQLSAAALNRPQSQNTKHGFLFSIFCLLCAVPLTTFMIFLTLRIVHYCAGGNGATNIQTQMQSIQIETVWDLNRGRHKFMFSNQMHANTCDDSKIWRSTRTAVGALWRTLPVITIDINRKFIRNTLYRREQRRVENELLQMSTLKCKWNASSLVS